MELILLKFETSWIASFDAVTCLESMNSRKAQDEKSTYNGLCVNSVRTLVGCKA